MGLNVSDITITSLETITAFDIVTGDYLFTLDELQNATIANTEDKQEITGKGGRKLSSIKRNKAVTISGANGMVSGGLFEVQTGGDFENKVTDVQWTDYQIVDGGKVILDFTAIGAAGNEIELYVRQSNGKHGAKLNQADSTTADNTFTYTAATKEITFSSNITDGTEVVAYYKRHIMADVLGNYSDNHSKKTKLYIDAFGEDKCANVYHIQFYVPKADFNGEFSIELGENQTVHNFEAESMAGVCGPMNQSGLLWTYTVMGAEAEDATE